MPEIIGQINLGADVKEALLKRKGKLGALLSLSEKLELNDFDATAALIHELNISMDSLMQAQTEAMRWAANINEPGKV